MTSLLEKTISIIAPHNCILCSKESNVLCDACFVDVFDGPHEVCFLCDTPTAEGHVCKSCSPKANLAHVWIGGTYDGLRKSLIRDYKFNRKRAAHKPLARALLVTLPYLQDIVVVPVPTAPRRIRIRGYDHVQLLAQFVAKEKGWHLAPALRRRHNDRQVGSTRAQRFRQAQTAYELVRAGSVAGKHVLLIDDVTTSGATLQAAAKLLVEAGAARVDAAVVAKHTLTS
jgi:ComF family protein